MVQAISSRSRSGATEIIDVIKIFRPPWWSSG